VPRRYGTRQRGASLQPMTSATASSHRTMTSSITSITSERPAPPGLWLSLDHATTKRRTRWISSKDHTASRQQLYTTAGRSAVITTTTTTTMKETLATSQPPPHGVLCPYAASPWRTKRTKAGALPQFDVLCRYAVTYSPPSPLIWYNLVVVVVIVVVVAAAVVQCTGVVAGGRGSCFLSLNFWLSENFLVKK